MKKRLTKKQLKLIAFSSGVGSYVLNHAPIAPYEMLTI
jgi:hypothetical protein